MPTAFPSFNWIRGVCDDTRISVIHRLVLIRLITHRQKDGTCHPGFDTVARELGVHRSTVFRATDVGVKFGWLAGRPHSGRLPRNFEFTFPINDDDGNRRTPATVNRRTSATVEAPTVAPAQRNRRTRATQPSQAQRAWVEESIASERNGHFNGQIERVKESISLFPPDQVESEKEVCRGKESAAKPSTKSERDIAEAFERFWAAYPRKVAKEAARKAFAAAVKKHKVEPERLIEAARRYAGERARQDPKFTKHATTWLNGGCWDDELASCPDGPLIIDGTTGEIIPTATPQKRSKVEEFTAEMIARLCGGSNGH